MFEDFNPNLITKMDKRLITDAHFPIAQLLLRASKATSPAELHTNVLYLAEVLLKLSAILRLSMVQSNKILFQAYLSSVADTLSRPSLGHWLMIFRDSSKQLENNEFCNVYRTLLLGDKKGDLPLVRAWAEECSKIHGGPFAKTKIEGPLRNGLIGFFELIVNYRNRTTGHGAILPANQLEKITHLLLSAIQEVLKNNTLLNSIKLVFAELKVVDNRNQIEWLSLHGPASFRIPNNQLALNIENNHEEVAGKVFAILEEKVFCLHPLVHYSNDGNFKEQFAFLNDVKLTNEKNISSINYMDYAYGHSLNTVMLDRQHISSLLILKLAKMSLVNISSIKQNQLSRNSWPLKNIKPIIVVASLLVSFISLIMFFSQDYQLEPASNLPILSIYKDSIISSVYDAGKPVKDPRTVSVEVRNKCSFPIQIELINLKSLTDRTDGGFAAELARRISFLLKPGQTECSREFNENSGPGIYMVFAVRLTNKSGTNPQWQAIEFNSKNIYSLNMFNKTNNTIIFSEEPVGSGYIKGAHNAEDRSTVVDKPSTPPI